MVKFFIHDRRDDVGVAVADIRAGEKVEGWFMEEEMSSTVFVESKSDIPFGHKIALKAIPKGARVTKYGVPIGVATQDIKVGEHVHIHNLKTARW